MKERHLITVLPVKPRLQHAIHLYVAPRLVDTADETTYDDLAVFDEAAAELHFLFGRRACDGINGADWRLTHRGESDAMVAA